MISWQYQFINGLWQETLAPRSTERPSDWCCGNVVIDEPGNRGPFSLFGREYLREMIDDWADPDITDQTEIMGSQSGKTTGTMGGAMWAIKHLGIRIFWAMPTQSVVRAFAKTRWVPMLRASPGVADILPDGSRRHELSTLQQMIGQSVVDFVWSNSPSALSSIPAQAVILDEVDKFNQGGKGEANAVDLAAQRTKDAADPKRMLSTTPTIVEGLGWQQFLKGDQRRRFIPCPGCSKLVLLIWSREYTIFRMTGAEAPVRWDREAKRKDGSWDLDRVERSARYECPHCGFHIKSGHVRHADASGQWKPTNPFASRGHRSRQLPSLYSPSPECSVERLAIKFLQMKASMLNLQGFINGDLAEPYQAQDTLGQRIEVVTSALEIDPMLSTALMTIDCQARAPHFWYVIRRWKDGDSEGEVAGSVDTWDDLRQIQIDYGVDDVGVFVDSGYGAKSEAEVYRNCARFSDLVWNAKTNRHTVVGWIPTKGMPTTKMWKHEDGLMKPYYLRLMDPFIGTAEAGHLEMNLLEYSGGWYADVLQGLRRPESKVRWKVTAKMATDEYWRHMDAHVKKTVRNKRTGFTQEEWVKRSDHWPDHLLDCERGQIAGASFHGLLDINTALAVAQNAKRKDHPSV